MGEPSGWYQAGVGGSLAELYERDLVPAIFGPWVEDLLAAADVRPGARVLDVACGPGARVLDVACGTGVVARAAAPRVGPTGAVVGLDLSPAMLAAAAALPSVAGAPIAWQEGNALALPFADRSFDVVVCQQGLQFFPDRLAAMREMRRVLVPGGRVALAVWRPIEHSPGFAVFADALDRHIGPDLLAGPFSLGRGGAASAAGAGRLPRRADPCRRQDAVLPVGRGLRDPLRGRFAAGRAGGAGGRTGARGAGRRRAGGARSVPGRGRAGLPDRESFGDGVRRTTRLTERVAGCLAPQTAPRTPPLSSENDTLAAYNLPIHSDYRKVYRE